MAQPALAIEVRRIPAHRTWELRQRVLRPHQRIEEMNYFGDHDADTAHFGAFVGDELLSIGSIYLAPLRGPHASLPDDGRTWQLRGMATAPGRSGGGLGAAVLKAAIEHAAAHPVGRATGSGGSAMWCNAREVALGFYEKFGFVAVSGIFELPGIGPHKVMTRALQK
jgi:GNAT superfamily N-acetyltransferase